MRLIAVVFIIVFLCVTLMQSASSIECIKEFSWVAEYQIDKLASDDTPIMPGKIFIYVLNYNPFPTSSTKNGILTRYIADSFLLKATPGTGHPSAPNKFLINTICGQEIELNFSDIDSIRFYTNCSVNPKSLAEQGIKMELDTDRYGGDIPGYAQIPLSRADPSLWAEMCWDNPDCKAWTYIEPGTLAGPNPNCWLKSTVPPPTHKEHCISGVK